MSEILTPLYKFVIYLEDRGSLNVSEIDFIDKNSLRGVIGKMEAMGLISKKDDSVSLSNKGYEFLNSILDAIHFPVSHWDGKWRVVYFSTPESLRAKRDKFRRDLESVGFRPIIKGLWFSPTIPRSLYDRLVKSNEMNKMALFIESGPISEIDIESVAKAWDFESHKKKFEEFIENAQKFVIEKRNDKIGAKQLILCYALILNSKPRLPIEFLPSDWPEFRAKLMYKKLKRIIAS